MNVLITGAKGFLGRNVSLYLSARGYTILSYDIDNHPDELPVLLKQADSILHFAGINRPLKAEEFLDGNVFFTKRLLEEVAGSKKKIPLLFTSSIQAEKQNPYGASKKIAEDLIFEFSKKQDCPVCIYRLYNVYGKGCRPFYNSVIATWCYQIAHGKPIEVNPENPTIPFVFIDDICQEFERFLRGEVACDDTIHYVEPHDEKNLLEVANLIQSFPEIRSKGMLSPQEGFAKKLYSTYLTYLEPEDLAYNLFSHTDERGSFTEFLKTPNFGQVSVNFARPGITKGNHYHHLKNEKFLVVSGTCEIALRKVGEETIHRFVCTGNHLQVVDIPAGYTHSIKNIGKEDAVTIMWANELYDPENPDTYLEKVE